MDTGLCITGHIPSRAKPGSGLKIQESCLSLEKFRAIDTFIIPKLQHTVIKLDELLFA